MHDSITPEHPQQFILHTPVENFQSITGDTMGIGALVVLHWVVSTSDSGDPAYSKPIVMVLGPLITLCQDGTNMGYTLDELGLSYHTPAPPLSKLWSSMHVSAHLTCIPGYPHARHRQSHPGMGYQLEELYLPIQSWSLHLPFDGSPLMTSTLLTSCNTLYGCPHPPI